jgi:type VI secretion system secreted protein VgrG
MTYVLTKDLVLCRLTTVEALSQPFVFELSVLSLLPEVDRSALLGTTMAVSLAAPAETPGVRHFHGYVAGFTSEFHGHIEDSTDLQQRSYQITLRPWLWLLTLSSSCRIFQNKTVPEIVKEVCAAHGFGSLLELSLVGSFQSLDYCVQYNETDFAFVSRLLEREGIYYYFKHTESEHKLVLVNHPEAHTVRDDNSQLTHKPVAWWGHRHIQTWRETHHVRSLSFALDDYDFVSPAQNLKTGLGTQAEHEPYAYPNGDKFEYPGGYRTVDRGNHYVECRLHEQNARAAYVSGTANVHGLAPGFAFTTTLRPDTEYLVVSTQLDIDVLRDAHVLPTEQLVDKTASQVKCQFSATEKKTPFRPERVTPRPTIVGVQTAKVVGAEDGAIFTDKHGRVQVRFPWFDKTKPDQKASCFIRVAQVWAGNGWGSIFIPRAGDEVVVTFVGGDPDQPLIVGSVYNGLVEPPFTLPADATKSGLRTRKLDGDKSTALWFDDAKGAVDMTGDTVELGAAKSIGLTAVQSVSITAAEGFEQVELSPMGGVTILGTKLALQCGAGKIEMLPSGAIAIFGSPILVNGMPLPGANPMNPLAAENLREVAQAVAKSAVL